MNAWVELGNGGELYFIKDKIRNADAGNLVIDSEMNYTAMSYYQWTRFAVYKNDHYYYQDPKSDALTAEPTTPPPFYHI